MGECWWALAGLCRDGGLGSQPRIPNSQGPHSCPPQCLSGDMGAKVIDLQAIPLPTMSLLATTGPTAKNLKSLCQKPIGAPKCSRMAAS